MMHRMARLLAMLLILTGVTGCRSGPALPLDDAYTLGYFDRRRAVESLDLIERTLHETGLVEPRWFAQVPAVRESVQSATTQVQVRAALTSLLATLNDPHYALLIANAPSTVESQVAYEPINVDARQLNGVIYIRIARFRDPQSTLEEVAQVLRSYPAAPGVVIDLQGNSGGVLGMAQGLAGFFVDGGSLGTLVKQRQGIDLTVYPRQPTFRGKVAILIDANTASAAEIFAMGMKGMGRATLFGQTTAGATRASAVMDLPNGDRLQYVLADYQRPAPLLNHTAGIQPDFAADPAPALQAAILFVSQP
jgi:hypothetical protein